MCRTIVSICAFLAGVGLIMLGQGVPAVYSAPVPKEVRVKYDPTTNKAKACMNCNTTGCTYMKYFEEEERPVGGGPVARGYKYVLKVGITSTDIYNAMNGSSGAGTFVAENYINTSNECLETIENDFVTGVDTSVVVVRCVAGNYACDTNNLVLPPQGTNVRFELLDGGNVVPNSEVLYNRYKCKGSKLNYN